jgi:hypothetical protein
MNQTPQQKLWARRLYGKSKKRAKEDGIPFTITPSDILVPTHCPVMGVELRFEKGIGDVNPSLDRVDNNRGYEPGNVRVISWRANYLKKNLTLEQAERLLQYMRGEI